MNFERLARNRIEEAMKAGAFDGLEGAGERIAFDPADELAGDQWLGFKILRNGSVLPEWLGLAKEIEADSERLEALDRSHAEWVAAAVEQDAWERIGPAIARVRERYEELARSLRRKQDRFNVNAPSLALERPALWVEHHLERLDRRVAEARPSPPAPLPEGEGRTRRDGVAEPRV